MFGRLEAVPGLIVIPVGVFADPDFAKPERMYWSSRKHYWLDGLPGVEPIETQ